MSVGDGRGTRGRYLAWCSAAMSTVAIAGMGVSAAVAAPSSAAAPAEDLPTEMVRLADGNSGYTCISTTTTTEPTTPPTAPPTTTTTTAEPTTTTTTTTAPAVTTTTQRCDPPKDHGKDDEEEHEKDGAHRQHVGGKHHHAPTCASAAPQSAPQSDVLHDLVGGLPGVGSR